MGRSTWAQVVTWAGTSSPHDQHRAKHRQGSTIGRTMLDRLAPCIPLHSPGILLRPLIGLRRTRMGRSAAASSAAGHLSGVPHVTVNG